MGKQRVKKTAKRVRIFVFIYWITVGVTFTAIIASNYDSDRKAAMLALVFVPFISCYALGISLLWNNVNSAWASVKAERQIFHMDKAREMLEAGKWRQSSVLINEVSNIHIRDEKFNRSIGYLLGYWHALEHLNNKELLTKK